MFDVEELAVAEGIFTYAFTSDNLCETQ